MPFDALQRDRAGAEHEAADLGERQAVGGGVAHHAAPDGHPKSAALARAGMMTSQAMPRMTNSTSCQPTITANSGQPIRLTEATTLPTPKYDDQDDADEHAQKCQNIGEVLHRGASARCDAMGQGSAAVP